MACNMLRFFHKQKISKDFRWRAALVSCGTLQVLQCKCERHRKEKVSGSENLQFTVSMWLINYSSSTQTITSTSQRYSYHEHVTCMINFALCSIYLVIDIKPSAKTETMIWRSRVKIHTVVQCWNTWVNSPVEDEDHTCAKKDFTFSSV